MGTEVAAYLVYENDLNVHWRDGNLDLNKIEEAFQFSFKAAGSRVKFQRNKEKGTVEACFQSLQIDHDRFERASSGKQVHEEKYRMVFITQLQTPGSLNIFKVNKSCVLAAN